MTEFRAANAGDIPAITALWHQGWHNAHAAIVPAALTELRTLDNFKTRTNDHLHETYIGEQNGTLAGFYMLESDELYQFYVAPAAQGTGVARAQISDAERVLHAAGHHKIWLACSIGNDRAARFYTKAGWVNAGTHRVDLESSAGAFPLDIWRFEKTL